MKRQSVKSVAYGVSGGDETCKWERVERKNKIDFGKMYNKNHIYT